MALRRFEEDLDDVTRRACVGEDARTCAGLKSVRDELVKLYKRNLVKINHSVMELVCAKNLIKMGYDVQVEHRLSEVLVCDLYGLKGEGSLIVEIETGFVSPEHALYPITYYNARLSSKIARYSAYSSKFALGTPPTNLLTIPLYFQKPPRHRTLREAKNVKALCDLYYQNPPISLEEIRYARLHSIFVIDVDSIRAQEIDAEGYIGMVQGLPFKENIIKS
ncbi:MAG: hypothetical protein ACUVQ8_02340 [Nitrososphaeria archaeon]